MNKLIKATESLLKELKHNGKDTRRMRTVAKHLDRLSCYPLRHKPIPKPLQVNRLHYPFHLMTMGESFSVPYEKLESARACANNYKKTHPEFNYCTRTVYHKSKGKTLRIWKVPVNRESDSHT